MFTLNKIIKGFVSVVAAVILVGLNSQLQTYFFGSEQIHNPVYPWAMLALTLICGGAWVYFSPAKSNKVKN